MRKMLPTVLAWRNNSMQISVNSYPPFAFQKRHSSLLTLLISSLMAVTISGCSEKGQQATPEAQTGVPTAMVLVPAGEFIMGSDDIDTSGKSEEFGFNEPWFLPEHPQRKINLKAFYIDQFELNNGNYKAYLIGTERVHRNELVKLLDPLQLRVNEHPVRNVSWHDANDYCTSVGKRLPTEAEWEKAARGPNGNEFPWGNEWHPENVNSGGRETQVLPVGSLPQGRSPYGVYDMAGNVLEWVEDWFDAYPGADYKSPRYGQQTKVARGGSWGGVGHYVIPHYFRSAYRYNFPPTVGYNDVGFRCAKDAP